MLERFRKTPDGALLGADFREKNRDKYPWKVGGTYTLKELGGVSITFVGVFRSDNDIFNKVILAGRRYLQEVDGQLGRCHQVYVKVDDAANAPALREAIDRDVAARFPYTTATTDQRSHLTGAVKDLLGMVAFSRVILAITLAVILLAVANTISMATRDRMREIGMLRSLGFRRGQILGLVLGESLLLSLVGGLVGLSLTWGIILWVRPEYGIRTVNLEFRMPPQALLLALGLSLAVGLAGGILPALGASRTRIVEALGKVD